MLKLISVFFHNRNAVILSSIRQFKKEPCLPGRVSSELDQTVDPSSCLHVMKRLKNKIEKEKQNHEEIIKHIKKMWYIMSIHQSTALRCLKVIKKRQKLWNS